MEHHPSSPREEALLAVLASQATSLEKGLSEATWEKLVALAWENRAHAGDRREIRKRVREILVEDLRRSGGE
jgi:hypothetical protein